MPKNVVVCCDGTANEFARQRTNVVKLFFTLAPIRPRRCLLSSRPRHDGAAGRADALASASTRLAGLAFGYGLSDGCARRLRVHQ